MQEFCSECGVELSEPGICQDCWNDLYGKEGHSPPPRFFMGKGLIILVVAVLSVLGAGSFYAYTYFNPSLDMMTALKRFEVEVEERLESTPISNLMMLEEILQDGKLELYLTVVEDDLLDSDQGSAEVYVHSYQAGNQYALIGNMKMTESPDVSFQAHLNPQEFVIGTDVFGEFFIGVDFNTFSEDVKILGENFGLDQEQMDMLSDAVKAVEKGLNVPSESVSDKPTKAEDNPYQEVLTQFVYDNLPESEKVKLVRKDKEETFDKLTVVFTLEEVRKLREDLGVVIEAESGSSTNVEMLNMFLDNYLEQFESLMEEGDIEFGFYVGKSNRLGRITTSFKHEGSDFSIILDLGNSISDDWTFDISADHPEEPVKARVVWGFNEDVVENKVVAYDVYNKEQLGSFSFISDKGSGDFRLDVTNADQVTETVLKGSSVKQDGGFVLSFDSTGAEEVAFELRASKGANIPPVAEYMNIRELDTALLMGLIMGGMNMGPDPSMGLDQEYISNFDYDLSGSDLEGLDLEGLDLEGLDLEGLDLEGLDLEGLDLEGLDLEGLDLEGLDLEGLDLEALESRLD